MRASKTHPPSRVIIERLRQLFDALKAEAPTNPAEIRQETKNLAAISTYVRTLSKVQLRNLTKESAARERILAYLKLFPREVIDGTELAVVSGIQEFARRIRELRVEFGYRISTGLSRDDLRPDQYVLETTDPDAAEAERWRTANSIRRQKASARERILTLLRRNVGVPLTGEMIRYVAKIPSARRRTGELRTELGWRLVTNRTGRPDLPSSVYLLESEEQLPPHDRKIPDSVYEAVLDRDEQRCMKCGWSVAQRNSAGRRQFLEVHHVQFHRDGGSNNQDNLITLCNMHHDEVHRAKLSGNAFFVWLRQSP
jgi:5-methylcytosine-specific restriction endonuclease McrA